MTPPGLAAGSAGPFVKTPAPHVVEVLATCPGVDFAILDGEHAPFDRRDLDMMLLAGKAAGLPLLVRTQDRQPSTILAALDLGAAGLVVPHVDSVAIAREVAALARYRGGLRGYSGSTRSGGYGTIAMADACDAGDGVPLIVQIEHPDAIPAVAAILGEPAIAGIVVGRADLALAMGHDRTNAAAVEEAVRDVFARAAGCGKRLGVVVGDRGECARFAAMGADWFVIGTDHSLMRTGVRHAYHPAAPQA
ncbi:MAG: aldolase/citrate lyase family protein [Sphingomonas fennica]